VKVVTVTGSECTGKTTLARALAARFDTVWVPEYVRSYLDAKGAELTCDDVEPIARGQMAAQDEAAGRASRLVVFDTDLLSTVVYSRHYYGDCPAWVEEASRGRLADLYLLLHPDVPWLPDGRQRDRPHDRERIHGLFAQALADRGARFVDVRGPWGEREAMAASVVGGLLAEE
jgi:NadR type nicotinamide-nucleotide adenylyltransferase